MFSTNKSLIRKKMPTGYRPWLMSSTLAVALLGPGAAYAEPSAAPVVRSPGALEEVIVTAERRDASAQDIPISISVLGNREIQAAGADNQTMLSAKIPSLSIYNQGGATYFLRGIGTSGSSVNVESSVANYIDGVYLYSTYTNYAPLFAVERVEVLKGPQGTLFGRNTTGGVIQMVTRDPLEGANAEFTATVGNYSTWGTTFYGSTLIEDNLGVSLAVDYKNQGDGYGWNSTRNTKTFWGDNFNIQGKVAYQPFAGTKLTGFLWYSDIATSGFNQQIVNGYAGVDNVYRTLDRYEVVANTPDHLKVKSVLSYVRLDQDIDFADLMFISSYNNAKSILDLDGDITPTTFTNATLNSPVNTVSEELQIRSKAGDPLEWVVGAYYFNGNASSDPIVFRGINGGATGYRATYRKMHTRSLAGFGQATYEVLPATRLTLGIRYTDEIGTMLPSTTILGDDTVSHTLAQKVDSSGWSGRAVIDHRLNDDMLIYASYNRGLKSGGAPINGIANTDPYFPEHLDAYEAGAKTELFDNRLRLNSAFFFYNFSDIQINEQVLGGTKLVNAAGAHIYGVDISFEANPIENLSLYGGVTWLHGRYTDYDNATSFVPKVSGGNMAVSINGAGMTTVYSPEWSFALGGSYTIRTEFGAFNLNGSLQHVTVQYVSPDNLLPLPSYTTVNAGLNWNLPDDHYGIRLWVRNMFDAEYFGARAESSQGYLQSPAPPRTFGVTFSANF